jgi:hypothetical protein
VVATVGNVLLKAFEISDLEGRIAALESSNERAKDTSASSSLRPALAVR